MRQSGILVTREAGQRGAEVGLTSRLRQSSGHCRPSGHRRSSSSVKTRRSSRRPRRLLTPSREKHSLPALIRLRTAGSGCGNISRQSNGIPAAHPRLLFLSWPPRSHGAGAKAARGRRAERSPSGAEKAVPGNPHGKAMWRNLVCLPDLPRLNTLARGVLKRAFRAKKKTCRGTPRLYILTRRRYTNAPPYVGRAVYC